MTCSTLPRELSPCNFTIYRLSRRSMALANSHPSEKYLLPRELFSPRRVVRHSGEPGRPVSTLAQENDGSGDDPITACCGTSAVAAALRPGVDGQPGLRRRLCRGHAGGPVAGPR